MSRMNDMTKDVRRADVLPKKLRNFSRLHHMSYYIKKTKSVVLFEDLEFTGCSS